jgi:methionyl-tRNA formyltransferase
LPRWRGAAPVERALLAGDSETGTCLMQLEEGLDTGPVFDEVRVPIRDRSTADELRHELVTAGTEQLLRCLRRGLSGARPQVGETTYAAKFTAEDFRIDWSRSDAEIDRQIRVGGAWTTFRGKRLRVLAASPAASADDAALGVGRVARGLVGCGTGCLRLDVVQPEGKAPMEAVAWANGARPGGDDVLGI